jgi:hypothetical protein
MLTAECDRIVHVSIYHINFILEKTCVITGTVVAVIDSGLFISIAFNF